MFCHFCCLDKKKNPFGSDKSCSNFKLMTFTRHLFCYTKMLQVNVKSINSIWYKQELRRKYRRATARIKHVKKLKKVLWLRI